MTEFTPEQIEKNRRDWIAALRSGNYKQTTGTLEDSCGKDPEYCCLGVFAKLHDIVDGGSKDPDPYDLIAQGLGVFAPNTGYSGAYEMVSMNDEDEASFAEIADHFEAKWGLGPAGGAD